MSPADVLRARAAEWRDRARFASPLVRARMLSKVDSIERALDGDARLGLETAATVRSVNGAPAIHPIRIGG